MRVLFLSKLRPQGRDLMDRPYGRFHHLPLQVQSRGHEVLELLIGHQGQPPREAVVQGLPCASLDLRELGLWRTWERAISVARAFQPDWIVGFSDAWIGCLCSRMAEQLGTKLALDAYDNYESYMPWNVPLHAIWRRSLRGAHLVTAAGPQLAAFLQRWRPPGSLAVELLPMAADPSFVPMDKSESRRCLGLPETVPLIGYSGGWGRSRGTDVLVDAFELARAKRPDALLVLSGRPPKCVTLKEGVLGLGYLPDAALPFLMNALDVACVVSADTSFGKYSYPSKLCEAMACGTAVAATATEPVKWMLDGDARFLATLADPGALANLVLDNLSLGKVAYPTKPDWVEIGSQFGSLLEGST